MQVADRPLVVHAAKRQWASRKTRPTPSSATAASEMANQKIGELADAKKQHYEAKLAMKQLQHDLVVKDLQQSALLRQQQHDLLLEEHALRMNVLNIQQQYYNAKLRKLSGEEQS